MPGRAVLAVVLVVVLAGCGAESGDPRTAGPAPSAAGIRAVATPRVAAPREPVRVRVTLPERRAGLQVGALAKRHAAGCAVDRYTALRAGGGVVTLDPAAGEGGPSGWCPGRYLGTVIGPADQSLARFGFRVCGAGEAGERLPRQVTYAAGARVAIATAEGEPMFSDRFRGRRPYVAKAGLYVRGRGRVTLTVPRGKRGDVRIMGWSGRVGPDGIQRPDPGLRGRSVAIATTDCATAWTAFAGGLVFRGRHCLRLRVGGPRGAASRLHLGLRRRCA